MRESTSPLEALARGVTLAALRYRQRRRDGYDPEKGSGEAGGERTFARLPSSWSERARALLARHRDRNELDRALRVGLDPTLRGGLGAKLSESSPLSGAMKALLATSAPRREIGRAWLKGAPPPRHGYVANKPLIELLAAFGAQARRADVAAKERRVGVALRGSGARSSANVGLAPDDDGGYGRQWMAMSAASRRRIERVAAREAGDMDAPRALGAVYLGYLGETTGDADSELLRNAGAELRDITDHGIIDDRDVRGDRDVDCHRATASAGEAEESECPE